MKLTCCFFVLFCIFEGRNDPLFCQKLVTMASSDGILSISLLWIFLQKSNLCYIIFVLKQVFQSFLPKAWKRVITRVSQRLHLTVCGFMSLCLNCWIFTGGELCCGCLIIVYFASYFRTRDARYPIQHCLYYTWQSR